MDGTKPTAARRAMLLAASAVVTAGLLARWRLRSPGGLIGRRLAFDGSTSWIYRETRLVGATTREPTLLVIRFRLRLIGCHPALHAIFRAESILNTPLFAGFDGFRSKLWATDPATGVYRGVYEWDGADRATTYAVTMTALLSPACVPGSVAFHVAPGHRREDFLRDHDVVTADDDPRMHQRPRPVRAGT